MEAGQEVFHKIFSRGLIPFKSNDTLQVIEVAHEWIGDGGLNGNGQLRLNLKQLFDQIFQKALQQPVRIEQSRTNRAL